MKKRKIRFLNMPLVTIWVIIMLLICIAFVICLIVIEPIRQSMGPSVFIWYLIFFCSLILLLLFALSGQPLQLMSIDDKGITRSFLGVFRKLHISWDNIEEARIIWNTMPVTIVYLIISKIKLPDNLKFNKTSQYRNKNTIVLRLTKKRYDIVMPYIKQPIKGLTEEIEKFIRHEK